MDVASCHLDGNADAVEFCPHQPFHHILAAATYTLEEGIQPNRSGSISLFSADADTGLYLLYRLQTVGVFDIKWNAPGATVHPLLAQADADGCLTLHSLQSSEKATTCGSYDEFLRVWDLRSTSKPVSKSSLCLGGGVWRIKHHPFIPDLVLAACMHNGFSVVRVGDETAAVVESYAKHESLAYGADWQRAKCVEDKKDSLVATCSFYDCLLRIWKPKSLMVESGN